VDLFGVIWSLLTGGLVALEVAGRLGLSGLVPLGRTLAVLRSNPVGRACLVVLWMWAGWHLFAR
jgi:hypothetical protein